MPDKIVNLDGEIQAPRVAPLDLPTIGDGGKVAGAPMSFNEMFEKIPVKVAPTQAIPVSSFYTGSRYPSTRPGTDPEEMYAQQQSGGEQWINGILKAGGTFTSSFVGGTLGLLHGVAKAAVTHRLSDIADNSTNRYVDELNKDIEDILPNYESSQERDAKWYSPDNLLTANFWSNKLLKNLGFSAGAIAAGFGWGKVLGGISKITGLVMAGRGAETAALVEDAMKAVPNVEKYTAFDGALSSMAQKYAINPFVQGIVKNGQRITISTMGSLGEASIQSLEQMNKFRDQAIDDFTIKYGRQPTTSEMEEIDDYTDKVGSFVLGSNALLLSATNYLTVPKILSSSRRFEKALINEIEQEGPGKAWTLWKPGTVGKYAARTRNALGLVFSPIEAFEEGAQSAIDFGVSSFFNKAYRNKQDADEMLSSMYSGVWDSIFGEGVDKTLSSKEGIESILIGGLSGGMQQMRGEIKQRGFFGEGGQKAINTEFALASLAQSNIETELKDQVKYLAIGAGSQRARQNAIMDNDVVQEKDSEHDFVLSYVMPRVKYGKEDSVYQELKYYGAQAATEAGYQELINAGIAVPTQKKEQFIERIEGLKAVTKSVANLYDAVNDRYGDITNEDGTAKYSEAVRDKLIYAAAKINNYDQRIPSLNASLLNAGINTSQILESIITDKKPNKEATQEALDAINKLDTISDTKDQLKENLSDVMEMAFRRKQFIEEYDKIKNTPENYDDYLPTTIDLVEQSTPMVEQIEETGKKRKKKKVVTKELEIGKEYSINQPYRRDGNSLSVSPKLSVVSTTLGGEYEVKLPNGETTFLTPEQFKEFELTDEDNTDDDLADLMDAAVDKVLAKPKNAEISKDAPEENKLDYVNSLDNKELVDEIEEEFKAISEEYYKQQQEIETEMTKLENAQEEIAELLSTEDDGPETSSDSAEGYEPDAKKADYIIPRAGVASPNLPGYENVNEFGNNFDKLPNKKKIRAVLVTQKTEAAAGLPGLMKHLAQGREDVNTATTIVMLFGEVNGKTFTPVDKNGKPITQGLSFANATFQVLPLESLKWSEEFKGDSMFRNSTPAATREAIAQEYGKFREEVLADDKLRPYSVKPSMGSVQESEDGSTTSVDSAGFVSNKQLGSEPLLTVPTSETTLSHGLSTFTNASGRVFLLHPSGAVPLQNSQISKQKAELIYDALARLAELAQNRQVGSEEGKALTDWLSTVVYWGTPVDVNDQRKEQNGRNSVFFESVAMNGAFKSLQLFVSNRGKSFPFTPKSLAAKKTEIIQELQNCYHNVKASRVNESNESGYNWNDPYVEITAINPDGSLKTKTWKNYQTYLLSSEGRNNEDIPLTTFARPITTSQPVNRERIYFTFDADVSRYERAVQTAATEAAKAAKASTAKTKKVMPGTSKPKPSTSAEPAIGLVGVPDLENKKVNDYNSPFGPIKFLASGAILKTGNSVGIDFATENGKIPAQNKEVINKVLEKMRASNPNATQLDAEKGMRDAIARDIFLQMAAPAETETETENVIDEVYEEEFQESFEADVNPDELAAQAEDVQQVVDNSEKEDLDDLADELSDDDISDARVALDELIDNYQPEDWKKLEEFIKANFPKIPVARVSRMLQTASGRRAFGLYKNGMIYLYKNAEVGTVYHEIFHAVWQMFTTKEERASIIKELRGRKGTFVDRASGKSISYQAATLKQLEELMSEESRDYFQEGKLYDSGEKQSFFGKLLSDLANFIKEFFVGKNAEINLKTLFERMGSGYYSNYESTAPVASFYSNSGIIDIENLDPQADDASYRLMTFTGQEQHDMIQQMTFTTLDRLINSEKGLTNGLSLSKAELIPQLHRDVQKSILAIAVAAKKSVDEGRREKKAVKGVIANAIQRWREVRDEKTWNEIVKQYEDKIRTFGIVQDEESTRIANDPYKVGKSDYVESYKIDNFKNASAAVKLLLATLPMYKTGTTSYVRSKTINGVVLLPASQAYMTIMNITHSARNINEFLDSIRQLAIADINYARVYKRLLNTSIISESVDYSNITKQSQVQLINSFWKSFKKQNPDVLNTYILENGDIVVGESNFTSAANQVRDRFENNIKEVVKQKNDYFEFNDEDNSWYGNVAPKSLDKYKENINTMAAFLKTLGIVIDPKAVQRLPESDQKKFTAATAGIIDSISSAKRLVTINGRVLDIKKRLLQLGQIQAKIENPEFSSTYFNVSGERVQTFIGTNPASDLYDFLSKLTNKNQLKGTKYAYLLTDSYSQYSVIMDRMFDPETGKRIPGTQDLMKTAYADGIVDKVKGKQIESSSLSNRDRLIQELNMNMEGYYMNLVPGDASMEWMMKMGNAIKSLQYGYDQVFEIFKGYFISEMNLSREGRKIDEVTGRSNKDLRFFKAIFRNNSAKDPNAFHTMLIKNQFVVKDGKKVLKTAEQIYEENKDDINSYVQYFISNQANMLLKTLNDYNVFEAVENEKDVFESKFLSLEGGKATTLAINRKLQVLTANYIINNIELHKLLYSDPYQYEDELKRIKNFNSPRQPLLHGSNELTTAMSKVYDEGLEPGDIGYSNLTSDSFTTTTLSDVMSSREELPGYVKPYKETDGGGLISFPAYRRMRILSDNWNEYEEGQYQYDIAFEKKLKNKKLTEKEADALAKGNPQVRSAYTTIKPIVAGNKIAGKTYNDVVLDKFALTPLSYRILHELSPNSESNALKLYNKMQAEKIDYVVFKSSRKVGALKKDLNDPYKNGQFNTDKYKGVFKVPVSIVSIQTDVPSKEDEQITRGSQVTKLITMDFLQAGVPIDYKPVGKDKKELSFTEKYTAWNSLTETQKKTASPLYKEISNNQTLLQEITEEGYQTLLKKFGISEKNGEIKIVDKSKVATTLREELMKREVNVNMGKALDNFLNGHVVLEATPAYQQIRNILYSIADRNVISPKMSGGMKVQIPSTFLETVRGKELPNGAYQSDILNFYEKNGKRVCEIMVGRWFADTLGKTDEELLEYLNTTKEGQEILSGLAFRIPTQKQNSIDAFVIKQFLPYEYGDNVVVPSALVNKVGSDFDIDKLNMYLKNVYSDGKDLRVIPFYGYGEAARREFRGMYEDQFNERINKIEDYEFFRDKLVDIFTQIEQLGKGVSVSILKANLTEQDYKFYTSHRQLLQEIINQAAEEDVNPSEYVKDQISRLGVEKDKLIDQLFNTELKERYVDRMYKKSLQNEYIKSSQNLVSHPDNFDQLVKPNSADQLKDLAKEITELRGLKSFDYTNPGNILNRMFMNRLRGAFVTGKYAIGIAAVNQTNHSLNQRQPMFIDTDRFNNLSADDQFWMNNDPSIRFTNEDGSPLYNTITINGKEYATLSMIKDATGRDYISDVLGQFIDGYVDISKGPWIMELGATPNVASTYMFLAKIGVPIDTIAYFMNQPIIREYLKTLENSGYTWLFNTQVQKQMYEKYGTTSYGTAIPSKAKLKENITKKTFSGNEAGEQVFLLNEFLKYAKMAEQMFKVTQAANFDTATFNDPFLVFRKEQQLLDARDTIISSVENNEIISGVDGLLKNSFIGFLGNKIGSSRDVIAKFLKADQGGVRQVLQDVLRPYVSLNENDFLKVSQKAAADLFDWAVQVDKKLNLDIQRLLLNDLTGTATVMSKFIQEVEENKKHPMRYNHVLKILSPIFSDKRGNKNPNNIKLINKDNKVYDQNQIIYGFLELKDYLQSTGREKIYKDLVKTAILQSGISGSPISFTSLIPYEDFVEEYNDTLSSLDQLANVNLTDFHRLGVFQRNNWSNNDIVPHRTPTFRKDFMTGKLVANTGFNFEDYPDLQRALDRKTVSKLYRVSALARGAKSDFIVYTWQEIPLGKNKETMRKQGDFSYVKRGLFQKVYVNETTPLIIEDANGNEQFVYSMVNAWGDSYRANEFYTTPRPSQIDNGFEKVEYKAKKVVNGRVIREASSGETSDSVIVRLIGGTSVTSNFNTASAVASTPEVIPASASPATIADLNKVRASGVRAKIENINGIDYIVSEQYVPDRIPKGYTKYYSVGKHYVSKAETVDVLYERYGKPVVAPGYEDIKLMTMLGDTKTVIELTTGLSIGEVEVSKLSDLPNAVKEKFDEHAALGKNVRDILANSKKIDVNGTDTPVLESQKVSIRGKEYDMSVITKEFMKSFGLTPKEVREVLEKICK